jgi:hypothetical protein
MDYHQIQLSLCLKKVRFTKTLRIRSKTQIDCLEKFTGHTPSSTKKCHALSVQTLANATADNDCNLVKNLNVNTKRMLQLYLCCSRTDIKKFKLMFILQIKNVLPDFTNLTVELWINIKKRVLELF